ncbi:heme-binding protein [Micromonospora sp. NPDC050980]|uniref:GlcG/HbpS family heme-binding protein n=1 Tax=Micromonospora sp. NPDC050980 TaxID=3155161 RepID=UPI0033DFDE40
MTLIQQPDMSHELARRLVDEVHAEAARQGVRLAAAVVDRGGNLVAAGRMDGAQLGALTLGLDKAFTAASFGHPTSAWIASSAPGGGDWGLAGTLGGRAVVFPGGIPLYAAGQLVGGLGVSGAASPVDEACAEKAAGNCALETRP